MDQGWRDTFEAVLFDWVDAKHGMSWAGDKDTLALGGDGYSGPYITKAREEKCQWWREQLKTLKQNTVKWDPASKKHQTH